MAREETRIAGLDTVVPAGTIVSCADCGAGFYKVTARATTADLVLDDGTILQPQRVDVRTRWTSCHMS
jgi:hypothetical protein